MQRQMVCGTRQSNRRGGIVPVRSGAVWLNVTGNGVMYQRHSSSLNIILKYVEDEKM